MKHYIVKAKEVIHREGMYELGMAELVMYRFEPEVATFFSDGYHHDVHIEDGLLICPLCSLKRKLLRYVENTHLSFHPFCCEDCVKDLIKINQMPPVDAKQNLLEVSLKMKELGMNTASFLTATLATGDTEAVGKVSNLFIATQRLLTASVMGMAKYEEMRAQDEQRAYLLEQRKEVAYQVPEGVVIHRKVDGDEEEAVLRAS